MPILSPVLPVALAVAAALAPQGTDREAFAAALPKMRALAALRTKIRAAAAAGKAK